MLADKCCVSVCVAALRVYLTLFSVSPQPTSLAHAHGMWFVCGECGWSAKCERCL